MANSYFQFKQFTIQQDKTAMKVTTDGCLFGAWVSRELGVNSKESATVLDIGTGTGLLSLMLAQANNVFIDAIEIDKDAFEQASENVAASPWADKIKVIHGDSNEFASSPPYDLIVSNPPFYENELKGTNTKKNLAHHNDGLLLPDLLGLIKKNLKSTGNFYLLLPFKRNEEVKKMFFESDLSVEQICFVKQSTKHDYFRMMLKGALQRDVQTEIIITDISIKDDNNHYTQDFTGLLKEYYLHL